VKVINYPEAAAAPRGVRADAQEWSQAELGERLAVSRQAVNAIENGKHDPSLSLAFKIARLFGVPVEHVFEQPPA
jgi:putative transcriptional regulator